MAGHTQPVVVIDNYDSFTYNLVQYLAELGESVEVVRNDALTVAELAARAPRALVVSPGPGRPEDAGISMAAIRALAPTTPLLGVCLGHQCLGAAFGAAVVRAPVPVHGKTSPIRHFGDPLFGGLPNPFPATRYHSLVVDAASVPAGLEVTALTDDGLIMALRHRRWPAYGVQFHPESIATTQGRKILANFLSTL
jgi:anthranilate synthase component 2